MCASFSVSQKQQTGLRHNSLTSSPDRENREEQRGQNVNFLPNSNGDFVIVLGVRY